jgi:hypothetical protein
MVIYPLDPNHQDAVIGGFVKLSIGMSDGKQKYRLCEVCVL